MIPPALFRPPMAMLLVLLFTLFTVKLVLLVLQRWLSHFFMENGTRRSARITRHIVATEVVRWSGPGAAETEQIRNTQIFVDFLFGGKCDDPSCCFDQFRGLADSVVV